jgi:LPS-assembly lipoprotein
MSWSDRTKLAGLAALGAALASAGCESTGIHPLYASHGGNLQAELQSIAVDPIPDRLGHYLSDALQTDLNGTGTHVPPKYHLTIVPRQRVQTPLIDTVTERAQAASVITDVVYTLTAIGGGPPIATGTVTSAADYDRSEQRFANIRAARDAEIRDAHTVADQITQQIAAKLATR